MAVSFIVKTQDVDCTTRRQYKSRAGATKRFEEMLGYTLQNAIEEHYHAAAVKPTPDNVKYLRGVSMFGTVVIFEERQNG